MMKKEEEEKKNRIVYGPLERGRGPLEFFKRPSGAYAGGPWSFLRPSGAQARASRILEAGGQIFFQDPFAAVNSAKFSRISENCSNNLEKKQFIGGIGRRFW